MYVVRSPLLTFIKHTSSFSVPCMYKNVPRNERANVRSRLTKIVTNRQMEGQTGRQMDKGKMIITCQTNYTLDTKTDYNAS